jgi:hypothetical protein
MHRLEHACRGPALWRLGPRGHRGIGCTQFGPGFAVERPAESGPGDGGSDPDSHADGGDQRRRLSVGRCRRGRRLHRQRRQPDVLGERRQGDALADLCPSLPARWVVVTGSYRGGAIDITYKGSGGQTFQLREGTFCTDADGCVPEGEEFGNAAFGDQTATLLHLSDGRIAAVVDRGEQISWLAFGDGLDDAQFAAFTGALIRLD